MNSALVRSRFSSAFISINDLFTLLYILCSSMDEFIYAELLSNFIIIKLILHLLINQLHISELLTLSQYKNAVLKNILVSAGKQLISDRIPATVRTVARTQVSILKCQLSPLP